MANLWTDEKEGEYLRAQGANAVRAEHWRVLKMVAEWLQTKRNSRSWSMGPNGDYNQTHLILTKADFAMLLEGRDPWEQPQPDPEEPGQGDSLE